MNERFEVDRIISLLFTLNGRDDVSQRSRQGHISVWFERATQIMPSYHLCWQQLAGKYRNIGQGAKANRTAAPVRSLSSGAAKQTGIRSSKVESALLIVEQRS
jgi:hypothetical protein